MATLKYWLAAVFASNERDPLVAICGIIADWTIAPPQCRFGS
jgi:hypothetical protein